LTCRFADRSRGLVFVARAAQDRSSLDPPAGKVDEWGGNPWVVVVRRPLPQALVRPMAVVMKRVLGQDLLQMSRPEDQDPVQEFTA
jgi:hypothetical protein